jgi:hypothetical protein
MVVVLFRVDLLKKTFRVARVDVDQAALPAADDVQSINFGHQSCVIRATQGTPDIFKHAYLYSGAHYRRPR